MNIIIKKRIFDRLYEKLGHATIIDCEYTIWFVDVDNEVWYLEYNKRDKSLFGKYQFFNTFFLLFPIERTEMLEIIAEWVEEVLNCDVKKDYIGMFGFDQDGWKKCK